MSRSPGCFGLKWWNGSLDGDWFRAAADGGKFPMQEVVYQDRVRATSLRPNRFSSYCPCSADVRRDGKETRSRRGAQ